MYPDHIRRIRATRLCRNRRRDRRFTRHRRRVGRHPNRLLLRHPLLFGGNDRNRLRLRFAILRHDMQIEHGADAVAKFGEKVLQHIIIRFSALQIHQLLFPAIDNPIIVVVNPQRRMVENIQHFVASRHIGSRDLFPQHSPRDAFGVIFDQRCGYVPLADQIGLQLFRPSDRQPFVGFCRSVRRSIRADNDLFDPVVFQCRFRQIQETLHLRPIVPKRQIDITIPTAIKNFHGIRRFLRLHASCG